MARQRTLTRTVAPSQHEDATVSNAADEEEEAIRAAMLAALGVS